ncbi:MAG: PIN domain-containing protein [Jatrophihabitans sp.]|nr:MAG: PIN domain-containing protein [Jatrophihabitans sp.]
MTERLVCDSSAVVALLVDSGADGGWAAAALAAADLAAPALMPFEAANVIRRLEHAGRISPDQGAQAHHDLLDLAIEQWPYEPLAPRARELGRNLTTHDASYVALAELLGAALVSLDRRLRGAPDLRCEVRTP